MKNKYLIIIISLLIILILLLNTKGKNIKDNWNNWDSQKVTEQKVEPSPKEEIKEQLFASSYKQALEISKDKKIKVFLYFYNNSCFYCKKLDNETLNNKEVKKELLNYVIYKCNSDVEKALSKQYNVTWVPTYYILDSNENRLKNATGFKPKDEFINWLN